MVKLISILLFLYGCAFGLDNSYKLAINGVTTATASSFISPNVGQAQHTIYVSASSCATAPTVISAAVQGSYDNTTYFNIGPATVVLKPSSATASQGIGTGSGAYPYLRVNYATTLANACTVSIWYTGMVNPSGLINNSFYYFNQTISVVGAGTTSLVASIAGARFVVYGMYIINISGGTNVITLQDFTNGSACTGTSTITPQFPIAAAEKYTWPTSTVPYVYTPAGSGLCVVATGAGTSTVSVIGRYE